jgi:medium-chain acyl-[acyl-carrier-protein] hydrolase
MEEVSASHAEKLTLAAEAMAEQDLMWVLSRFRLQMQTALPWHSDITIETWPTARTAGVRAHRDFRLFDANENEIGQGATIWILLAKRNHRPVRIPAFVEKHQSPGLPDDLLEDAVIQDVSSPDISKEFQVRLTDLDFNSHVNNVAYLRWALDSLPHEVLENRRISDLQISFVGEGHYADTITVRSQKEEDAAKLVYRHQLCNQTNSRTLALLRTTWVPHS